MDGLQQRGAKLIYDPQFIAHRRPRRTLKSFCRMLFNYGRGRAEQFRLHPTPGSALNFVPPLFCAYLMLAPVLAAVIGGIAFAPLGIYLLVVLLQTLVSMSKRGFLSGLLAAPLLLASHIFYGLGFWRGLTTRLKPSGVRPPADVRLEIIPG